MVKSKSHKSAHLLPAMHPGRTRIDMQQFQFMIILYTQNMAVSANHEPCTLFP